MSDATLWAVVPAAGTGSRMRADRPKQYLDVAGKTVIEHAIDRLLAHPAVTGVVVALRPDDPWWPTLPCATDPRIIPVTGGVERSDSVASALDHLSGIAPAESWVLVHDAARPCLRQRDLDRLIQEAGSHAVGGLLAAPLADTLKRLGPGGEVVETVERAGLWRALTPQMFRLAALREALAEARQAGVAVTDESAALERLGHHPLLVPGHPDNLKITHPEDLPLAERFLARNGGGG